MAIVTTSSLSAPILQSFCAKLLSVPTPHFIMNTCALERTMPSKGGTTLRLRRYNDLQAALVPLGNSGVRPPGQMLTAVDIDCKIGFYGTYVQLNEQCTLQSQDAPLNEATVRLGVSLRRTEDALTRDMLQASASRVDCSGGVNGDVPTEITLSDVEEVTRALLSSDAQTVLDNIQGEDRLGTAPVRNAYIALCHTDLTPELSSIAGFTHKNNYPDQRDIGKAEWGCVNSVRFFVSSVGSTTTNGSVSGRTIYNNFVCGMESYAFINQDGASAEFIYRDPIYDGPLAQNASVGWKAAFCPRLINDLWLYNLRSTKQL
jgi:N4-gp56 family major capsid protein